MIGLFAFGSEQRDFRWKWFQFAEALVTLDSVACALWVCYRRCDERLESVMRVGLVIAAALMTTGANAADGQWFESKFGEQRAYFQDWLAVCDDSGAGQCRLVQEAASDAPDSSFYRVAILLLEADRRWVMEISSRYMPADQLSNVSFIIDGNVIGSPEGSWKVGSNEAANLAETITVTDPEMMETLLTGMRDGASMQINYLPPANGSGVVTVSLRGVTAGTEAILANYAAR